jgi:signal transduction histidine kinase/ligand-binding sensor domain-containing protein
MKNLQYSLFIILLSCWCTAYSQSKQTSFSHIETQDGLSQSNILCIQQDKNGFMWFGSWEGLNKYDGYKTAVYKNKVGDSNSISNNFINCIANSRNNDLWVGTNGGGLCRFNNGKDNFTRYRHNPKDVNSISYDFVKAVLEDESGKVWIGTQKGLDLYDPAKNKFEHFICDPNNKNTISDVSIKCILKDSNHNLWIGTVNGGLNLYHPATKSFTRFTHDKNNPATISSNDIYSIFEDSKKRLWIGTNGAGLNLLDRSTGQFTHFTHDDKNPNSLPGNVVLAINEDAKKNLWISAENRGLCFFNYTNSVFTNIKTDEIDKESISNNSVYAIFRDSKENMWLGNFAGGIDMANRDKIAFTHFRHRMDLNSLSNNQVLSITEDKKRNIWIGTDGGGLNLFDPITGNFTHYRHKKNNSNSICGDFVLTSFEDRKGNIWIGTWENGITVFNPAKNSYTHFKHETANVNSLTSNNVWKIFEDRDGNIWVGTFGGGLHLYNPQKKNFTHFNLNNNRKDGLSAEYIVNIFEDKEGLLWICTDNGGVTRLNKKTNEIAHFVHQETKNSISNNNVNSILEDRNGDLWICTMSGLNKFNKKTGQFIVYSMANGLPDDYVFGILEDGKNNLWLSTNKGISRFNPVTGQFKNFGPSDGLQSNKFKQQAFCKSLSGMMYFGGINGFNQFSPDSIKPIAFDPPLVLTNLLILNKRVLVAIDENDPSPLTKNITETKTVTLPYKDDVFTFEFASLNYTNTEKKQYAYMLEGFDKDWNEVGTTRMATYTHLDPGTYRFKVKGFNNEGEWSKNIATILVIITPPYWLTWWFKLAIFAAVTGTVIVIYRLRINAIDAQKKKLQQQVQEQTRQLVISAKEEHKARTDAETARHETEIANNELKIKNQELEQFAYVASHDLQEPLRTTTGFVELIQKQYYGRLDAKADKYLEFIADASQRMRVLIKDLLDFSRIGANGELERVDCNIIMKNLLSDIMVAIDEAGACIEFETLPVIIGDPTEVKILFQNLVTNAIKFRRKDIPPTIFVKAERKENFWEFTFKDNGIGIEKQYSQRIFDIFQRLHTRTEYAGSGIGLSHCKKIVELHNGKIWFESIPGEGSTFYFTLPAGIEQLPV